MLTNAIVESHLPIKEIVFFVNVKVLFAVCTVLVVNKFVVVTICLISYMTVLYFCKHIPMVIKVISSLEEGISIEFFCIRIVILIIAIAQQMITQGGIGDISQVSEVIARELLQSESSDNILVFAFVVDVPNRPVSILLQSLLSYKVALFHG